MGTALGDGSIVWARLFSPSNAATEQVARRLKSDANRQMPKRIVLLVSSMGSGGSERIAATLANAWTDRGDSVLLVPTFSGRGDCFFPLSENVQLQFLADHVSPRGQSLLGRGTRLWALRQLIVQHRPDVVVSFLTNVNIAAVAACMGLRLPLVVSERTYPPLNVSQSPSMNVLRRIAYPMADAVVMPTQRGLQWLEDEIPSAKGCVIPNPVSYPLAASEPTLRPDDFIAPQRKVLLAVGRLDTGKQFHILLRAFAELAAAHPVWDLVILGDGPSRPELERERDRLRLGTRVHLFGRTGNVGDWYERAALFVLSSRYEGFPNTLAEAMSHGCPAVSYDCDTGPRDIIRDRVDGILVNPVGAQEPLSRALGALMADDGERSRMAQRALEVRARFSRQSVLAMWDKLFLEVCGTPVASGCDYPAQP